MKLEYLGRYSENCEVNLDIEKMFIIGSLIRFEGFSSETIIFTYLGVF